MRQVRLGFLLLGTYLALVIPFGSVGAQMLEEVVVTAQKRSQSLQDVPLSVSVASGEQIDRLSLDSLEELSGTMPNVTIAENATQDSVTIRAIGSGANQGFEQSVGTFIDGIYFGRGRSSRSPFLDVERVEVLKGPQGVLFGKNTIAGALNITTRRPTAEFESYVEGEYFEGDDSFAVTGVISGPLSDTVAGRVVARYMSADGYVNNVQPGQADHEIDSYVLRGSLMFEPSDRLGVFLKAEAASYDVDGRHMQIIQAGPFLSLYQSVDPNYDDRLDYSRSVNNDIFGLDFDYTDSQNLTAEVTYDFDNLTLVSTTAFVGYDYNNNTPANFAANIETATKYYDEDHSQFSQELRLESATGGLFEYQVGGFFQKEEVDHVQDFAFDTTAAIANGFPLPPFVGVTNFDLEQDTDSIALFAQGTWNINDRFRATFGLRYTDDEKELDYVQTTTGTLPFPSGSLNTSRNDSDTTPAVNLQYDASDDVMLYGSFSQGFKSGGFDFESGAPFEEETVDAWEFGMKGRFLDSTLDFNVALFDSAFEDLQVAAWNGQRFVTGNAAEASTQGLEMDFRWAISDSVQITGALALLNAEYDSFPAAVCGAAQQVAHAAATGLPPGTCTQDLSGRPLQFAPDYAGNLNVEYYRALDSGLELTTTVGIVFSDSYFTALDLDPIAEQDSFAKLNASVAVASSDRWSIALVGKNLTDERTTTWVNDIPFFRGAFFGSIDPPRSFGVQARMQW